MAVIKVSLRSSHISIRNFSKVSLTWRNGLVGIDEEIDDFVGQVVELGHAEGVVVSGAHVGQVLRPHRVLGVLDLEDPRRRMVDVLLLALLLLLYAIRAATREVVGCEVRVLVVGRVASLRLLIVLILPVVVHRLHLLLQPLVLLVEQVLLVLGANITYHECHEGDGN